MDRAFAVAFCLILSSAAAGCLSGAPQTAPEGSDASAAGAHAHGDAMAHDHGHGHEMDLALLDGFRIDYKNCKEAGGVSLYNLDDGSNRWPVTPPVGVPVIGTPVVRQPSKVQGPTKDFNRTSISDDTGDPKLGSYYTPIRGTKGTTGIWHTAFTCQSHSLNGKDLGPYEGGWVGVRVEPPAWDTSGVKRHYFVADLSFNQLEIVQLIRAATGLHASLNLDAKVEFPAPNVLHTILDDEDHGVFQTDGPMKEWTPKDPMDTMRFWMLINPGGHGHAGSEGTNPKCECIPIAFDVDSTKGKYMVFEGSGYLSHSRTDAHGNEPVAHGNVGGMAYLGFDRTMTVGAMPDIVLEQTWLH